MASTPHKRAADADWETSSTKTLRGIRPTVAGPSTPRGATFRVGPQPARQPLANTQQPRQHPAHTSPLSATQSKPPSSKQFSSTCLPSYESRLGPRYNKPPSLHTAPAHLTSHTYHQADPGDPHLPTQAGPSHPPPAKPTRCSTSRSWSTIQASRSPQSTPRK